MESLENADPLSFFPDNTPAGDTHCNRRGESIFKVSYNYIAIVTLYTVEPISKDTLEIKTPLLWTTFFPKEQFLLILK